MKIDKGRCSRTGLAEVEKKSAVNLTADAQAGGEHQFSVFNGYVQGYLDHVGILLIGGGG